MIANMSRVSNFVKTLSATAVASCALLAPTMSYAQTDQVIVVFCTLDTNPTGVKDTITINLKTNSVVDHGVTDVPGGTSSLTTTQATVTQVTDEQITWAFSPPSDTGPHVLNRYTGHLTFQSQYGGGPTEFTCQKQQKQF